jgi:hypothetical protein
MGGIRRADSGRERVTYMLLHPVKVFIVDDSAPLREVLCELIADPGYVEIAGAAEERELFEDPAPPG